MTDDSLFLIDIDKILRTKAPKHYKYIPKFIVSYLKKIVHQEEINVFLRESKDKLGEFTGRWFIYICVQSSVGRTRWCSIGLCSW